MKWWRELSLSFVTTEIPHWERVLFRVLGPILAVGLVTGCSAEQRPVNLLLITLDTTRADRIGAYGDDSARTSSLDSLAAAGTLFETVYSSAPETLPSHASLMTGLYPPSHGARLNGKYRLDESATTLAEIFQGEGFFTAAVVGSAVLAPQYGLDQGFELYDVPEEEERRADAVTASAMDALRVSGERPFALWVHYYDPHSPFLPPEDFRPANADAESAALYEAEIAYMDHWIGQLLQGLDEQGRLEDTLVAVVSDHGESLGDYGETYHTHFVYDSTIRVPLILKGPGIAKGVRAQGVVASLDLFATILELFGLAAPATASRALPAVAGSGRSSDSEARHAYSETLSPKERYGWSSLASLRNEEWLYIEAPREELYPAGSAPGAPNLAVNPVREHARALQRMRREMESIRSEWPLVQNDAQIRTLSEDERRTLESLGYLSASRVESTSDERAEDPKDMIEVAESIAVGRLAHHQGRAELALKWLSWAAAADPNSSGIFLLLGRAQAEAGRLDEAYRSLKTADALEPASVGVLIDLSLVCEASDRRDEADLYLHSALAVSSTPELVWLKVGKSRLRRRSVAAARNAFKEVLAIDPDQATAVRALRELDDGESPVAFEQR